MADGNGPARGLSGRGSSAALNLSLDRRFQGVSNSMESIQELSSWCIENKKYHSLIVRYWMKWIRKSDAVHRLNLFYLANDVIQNCKRRNAIEYRASFAAVLPEAAKLVRDSNVRKSVERILTIWMERSVYPGELISELKANLVKKQSPAAPVKPKDALRSRVVAEFAPQTLVEQLRVYGRSLEDAEHREKQLAALRVDVCSTQAFKMLKDKAGGKQFWRDFEEGSGKLREFVSFLEQQVKGDPPLLEALNNADIFYELQYKEVKIVANAYKMFANRVSNLKHKLDGLKSTLPGLDDSPVPSPSEDAPSPVGSESPRLEHSVAVPSPLLFPPIPSVQALGNEELDNCDVEDMELSEGEDAESAGIIVEGRMGKAGPFTVPEAESGCAPDRSPAPKVVPSPTPRTTAPSLPNILANVDLGKISSILSSLTSVMKSAGTPSPVAVSGTDPKPPALLAGILSQKDITREGFLSALSQTRGQSATLRGLSSILHNEAGNLSCTNAGEDGIPNATSIPNPSAQKIQSAETTCLPSAASKGSPTGPTVPISDPMPGNHHRQELEKEGPRDQGEANQLTSPESAFSSSLESKIHTFLQGHPGFGISSLSAPIPVGGLESCPRPLLVTETVDGTPVRAELGSTPTQDEVTDSPVGRAGAGVSRTHSGTGPKEGSLNHSLHQADKVGSCDSEGARRSSTTGDVYQNLPLSAVEQVKSAVGGLPHYCQIETLVSSTSTGEGYRNHQSSDRIQSAECIPVIDRSLRSHPRGGEGDGWPDRKGVWYGEGPLYHDLPPLPPQANSGRPLSAALGPQSHPCTHPPQFENRPPMSYHGEGSHSQSSPTNFFSAPLPPIPRPPPPPSQGMVGDMVVPPPLHGHSQQSYGYGLPTSPRFLQRPPPGPLRQPPHPVPLPQRQFLRHCPPHPMHAPYAGREQVIHGSKRPGPAFGGAPREGLDGTLSYASKRPFLPPHQ